MKQMECKIVGTLSATLVWAFSVGLRRDFFLKRSEPSGLYLSSFRKSEIGDTITWLYKLESILQ